MHRQISNFRQFLIKIICHHDKYVWLYFCHYFFGLQSHVLNTDFGFK